MQIVQVCLNTSLFQIRMKTPEEFNVVSRIVSLKLNEFKLEKGLKNIDRATVVFDHSLNIKVIPSGNIVSIESSTRIYNDSKKTSYIGILIVNGEYEVANLKDILSQFGQKIPTNLLTMFVGAQLSTSRGFLILKSEGTPLEGIIFGLIDPLSFFPQNQTTES